MISRTNSVFTTFGLLAALSVGCGSSTSTADAGPTGTDVPVTSTDHPAGSDVPVTPTDAGTCTTTATGTVGTLDYVINALSIDSGSDFNQPHTGFNVDNAFSPAHPATGVPDCAHQDFFSGIDPDQNHGTCTAGATNGGTGCVGGVDNQLPSLATTISAIGTNIGTLLNTELSSGKLILLVRVAGVHGTPGPGITDCNVHVSIFVGHPTATDCSTIFSGTSNFVVDNDSLATAGDLTTAKFQFDGQIVNGRLQITPGGANTNTFMLPLPAIMGVNIVLNVHAVQVRVSMTQSAGTNGNLGGYLLQSETTAAIAEAFPQYETIVGGVIGGLVDVATGSPLNCGTAALPDGGANPNGGIGFGFGFTTVGAVIAPTVTAPPSTACGTASATDGGTTPTSDAAVASGDAG